MPMRPWQHNIQRAQPGVGYVVFTGNVADGDTVAINGRVYEFDTAAAPGAVTAGNVRVDVSGGVGAAAATAALVAAINADTSRSVDAADIGGNVAALIGTTAGVGTNYTLTNPVDGGGTIAVSGANLVGGAAETLLSSADLRYTVTAQDVTTLATSLGTAEIVIGGSPTTTAPRVKSLLARTAAGAIRDLTDGIITIRQANTNLWLVCYAEPAAGALLVAGDILDLTLAVAGT